MYTVQIFLNIFKIEGKQRHTLIENITFTVIDASYSWITIETQFSRVFFFFESNAPNFAAQVAPFARAQYRVARVKFIFSPLTDFLRVRPFVKGLIDYWAEV